jgi:hypothetical protein
VVLLVIAFDCYLATGTAGWSAIPDLPARFLWSLIAREQVPSDLLCQSYQSFRSPSAAFAASLCRLVLWISRTT